jgi:hypothetical protein
VSDVNVSYGLRRRRYTIAPTASAVRPPSPISPSAEAVEGSSGDGVADGSSGVAGVCSAGVVGVCSGDVAGDDSGVADGGTIRVCSQVGRGSTFRIELPAGMQEG